MNNNILLSIVVPTYNMEKYLSRCLDSILHADFNDILEVILVNDGSKDRSLEIALEYRDKYPELLVVVDKENGGHGSTINSALAITKGKYFKVLDSDDWFDTDAFSLFLNALAFVEVDMILTPYTTEYVYENRSTTDFPVINIEDDKPYLFDHYDWSQNNYWLSMHSITYRTSIFRDNKIKISEGVFFCDTEFVLFPLAYVNTFMSMPMNIYHYFIGREGQSVSELGYKCNIKSHIYICNSLLDYYIAKKEKLSLEKIRYFTSYISIIILFNYNLMLRLFTEDFSYSKSVIFEIKSKLLIYSPEIIKVLKNKSRLSRLIFKWPSFFINILRINSVNNYYIKKKKSI